MLVCFGGDAPRCAPVLPDLFGYHMEISTNIAAHLQLVVENVMRTPWTAVRLLLPDAVLAQEAARELRDHLVTARARSMTSLENALMKDGRMGQLESFANREAPVSLGVTKAVTRIFTVGSQ